MSKSHLPCSRRRARRALEDRRDASAGGGPGGCDAARPCHPRTHAAGEARDWFLPRTRRRPSPSSASCEVLELDAGLLRRRLVPALAWVAGEHAALEREAGETRRRDPRAPRTVRSGWPVPDPVTRWLGDFRVSRARTP